MNKVFSIILVSYAIVLAPGCKNRGGATNTNLSSNSSSQKSKGLMTSQQNSVEEAKKELVKIMRQNNILAQDARGNHLSGDHFLKALSTSSNDLYLLDNSNVDTARVMMGLKINTGTFDESKMFVKSDGVRKATHFSFIASMWERKQDSSKGELLWVARSFAKISDSKNMNVKSMKAAISDLSSELTDELRPVASRTIVKVSDALIIGLVVLFTVSVLVVALLKIFGKKIGAAGHGLAGALVGVLASRAAVVTGALAVLVSGVKGLAGIFNRVPPAQALPTFDF